MKEPKIIKLAPIRYGQWFDHDGSEEPYCVKCGTKALFKEVFDDGTGKHQYVRTKSNYCPYCGAKMDRR